MSPNNDRQISAVKFIRPVNWNAGKVILECNDHNLYLVQFADSRRYCNDLAIAWIGSNLARSVGLPVAEQKQIYVSSVFLHDEMQPTFRPDDDFASPRPGVHYGSALVGATSGSPRLISYLPQSDVKYVTNRSDFLGMYLFDLWAERSASREVLFQRRGNDRELRATFLNDSKLFSGPAGVISRSSGFLCKQPHSLYAGLWSAKAVRHWINALSVHLPEHFDSAIATVPTEWCVSDLHLLHGQLLERLRFLPELIEGHSYPSAITCAIGSALPTMGGEIPLFRRSVVS